ncbi:MAG: Ankyrin repeat protein [Alphaproteobacteria bacterium ADurb.Bin438]|nr:MAG: Ankyrin repeat protein [Alphaproteobacteria bacterium ADurb.Bin438]
MLAILNNYDEDVVEALIDAGANVNIKNEFGESLLLMVTRANTNIGVLKAILKGKPDMEVKDNKGYTPLLKAVSLNSNPDIVEALINAGSYVNEVLSTDGSTPLIIAIKNNPNPKVAEVLIKNGANVSILDKDNKSALDYMGDDAKYKSSEALKMLVAKLVEIKENTLDKTSLNKVFMLLVRDKNTDINQLRVMIDNGAYVNATTSDSIASMKPEISKIGYRILRQLSGQKNVDDYDINALDDTKLPMYDRMLRDRFEPKVGFLRATPLMIVSSYNDNLAIIEFFVKIGAEIDQKDGYQNTALHYAVVAKRKLSVIKMLVNLGADINLKNSNGYTPLMYASINGDEEVVKFLISSGANISLKNKDNKNAYDYAILYERFKDSDVLSWLKPISQKIDF